MSDPEIQRTSWPSGSLLAGMASRAAAELLRLGTAREFGPCSMLLREGEVSTHVFVLVDGCVKVTATTPEGRLALLAIRVGGDIVGELASLDSRARSATVTAVGRVLTRVVAQPVFQRFLTSYPDAALAVSRSIGAKLRTATQRRVDFGGCDVKVRLARVLVELAASYAIDTPDGLRIGIALSQPELAALVGAAEPTVHKILAELRRERVIATGYRCLTVRDHRELRRIAEAKSASR